MSGFVRFFGFKQKKALINPMMNGLSIFLIFVKFRKSNFWTDWCL